jgi:hypothetical protein
MYSYAINEKIDPNAGANLTFKVDKNQCITLPRNEAGLRVGVTITTFSGFHAWAKHYYASFNITSLRCQIKGAKSTFVISKQPKESQGYRIDIAIPAKKNIYSMASKKAIIEIKEGEITQRFDSISDVIEAVESEFNRLFGEPWVLCEQYTDNTWNEYVNDLKMLYGC